MSITYYFNGPLNANANYHFWFVLVVASRYLPNLLAMLTIFSSCAYVFNTKDPLCCC